MTGFDLETVDRLLSTTRAVRKRLDLERPVDRSTILECIELSQQAPTAHDSQTWRWIVIDDQKLKDALSESFSVALPTIEKMRAHASTERENRFWDSVEFLTANLARVPVLVIPCVQVSPEERKLGGPATVYGSIFPAIWSFQLALRSRGLGSCLTTQHLMQKKKCDQLLGLPQDVEQIALLPVAYTQGTDFKSTKRPPPETITTFNGWTL
ncbi:nitroreductase family protein [Myxococcota bacterium]|nr:nitroreductase family protein [Myxococcota bacterium]